MAQTSTDIRLLRVIQSQHIELDRRLPPWARRSNPIIRRQLGMYWKTILPEVSFLQRAFVIQAGLILLSFIWPFLFDLALPAITASILLFPFAAYMYGHVLLAIGMAAVRAITDEFQNNTLSLLRVTPFDLGTIIASKVAAAVWRQVEDLGLLLTAAALMSMPLLISQYGTLWPLDHYPLLSRAGMIMGLAVSMLRLALEPFMIGMLGILMGAALRVRASAVIGMVVATFFYFLLINLPRLLKLDWPLRFVLEFIAPLLLPLLIIWGAFYLTRYLLTRE